MRLEPLTYRRQDLDTSVIESNSKQRGRGVGGVVDSLLGGTSLQRRTPRYGRKPSRMPLERSSRDFLLQQLRFGDRSSEEEKSCDEKNELLLQNGVAAAVALVTWTPNFI